MTATAPDAAIACEAGCASFSDECPTCTAGRLAGTCAANADSLHEQVQAAVHAGRYDPALRAVRGTVGVHFVGSVKRYRKTPWTAQFWNTKLGFPMRTAVGFYKTPGEAAVAYDLACLAMGLPAANFPELTHTEAAIAPVRAHLEARRKPR